MNPARAVTFSVAYGVAYIAVYYFNLSPLEYHPETGNITLAGGDGGQVIRWYGWVATASAAALVAAIAVPPRLAARIPSDIVWMLGIVLALAVLLYERRWFFD